MRERGGATTQSDSIKIVFASTAVLHCRYMEIQRLKSYLPEFVYGSIDGAVTTFAIVSGAMGAGLSSGVVIVLGVANVVADGLSMASGNYLSEKSAKASQVSGHAKSPLSTAVATFVSFVTVGCIPLAPFFLALLLPLGEQQTFLWAIVATLIAFIGIGCVRSRVERSHRWRGVVETVMIGVLASAVSYVVGYLLRGLAG